MDCDAAYRWLQHAVHVRISQGEKKHYLGSSPEKFPKSNNFTTPGKKGLPCRQDQKAVIMAYLPGRFATLASRFAYGAAFPTRF